MGLRISNSSTSRRRGKFRFIRLDFYVSYNKIDRVLKIKDSLQLYYYSKGSKDII